MDSVFFLYKKNGMPNTHDIVHLSLKRNITDIQISCDLLNNRYRNSSDLGTFRDRTEKSPTSRDSLEAANRFQDMSRYAWEPPGSELSNASELVFSN